MTGPLTVYLIGFILEIVGLAVAAYGFQRTWSEHPTGERFLEPLFRRVAAGTRHSRALLARVFQRHPRVVAASGTAVAIGVATSARARVGFGPLPSMEADPAAFATAVEARLGQLLERLQDTDEKLSDRISAETSRVDADRAAIERRIGDLANTTRNVAVGGIRLQVTGWFFVFFGFFLQALAQLVDGWNP
jgi:hypothetical protein